MIYISKITNLKYLYTMVDVFSSDELCRNFQTTFIDKNIVELSHAYIWHIQRESKELDRPDCPFL